MRFDITDLNKVTLLQSLYNFSKPSGFGIAEYLAKESLGCEVDSISEEDCNSFLSDFNQRRGNQRVYEILDYYQGKPMKVDFEMKNGRVLLDTESYDERNGLYRSFEAILNTFSLDEIRVVVKGYCYVSIQIEKDTINRPKEEYSIFKSIAKDLIAKYDYTGRYWVIDPNKKDYYNNLLGLNLLNT